MMWIVAGLVGVVVAAFGWVLLLLVGAINREQEKHER